MLYPQGAGEAHEPESFWSMASPGWYRKLGRHSGGHVVPEWVGQQRTGELYLLCTLIESGGREAVGEGGSEGKGSLDRGAGGTRQGLLVVWSYKGMTEKNRAKDLY